VSYLNVHWKIIRIGALSCVASMLLACSTSPPRHPDDICAIFREKRDWYEASVEASERWGAPLHVPMAIMYHESGFREDARPPMRYFLGFIPIGRGSSAYGYSQAQTPAWKDYKRESGSFWADRDDFADAVDFVQWYMDKTYRLNKVSKWDAYSQYLNYHEGWGGYRRQSYDDKRWLIDTARRVDARAKRYGAQYRECKDDLDKGWFWRMFSVAPGDEGSVRLAVR
jgi:hypothetical protein